MLDPHLALQKYGLNGARILAADKQDRAAIDAAAMFLDHAPSAGVVHASLLTAGLPHKAPGLPLQWDRPLVSGDNFRLISGLLPDGTPIGVPFGSKARMTLFHLQDRYLRTRRRDIPVGSTIFAWLNRIGRPGTGGATYKMISDQFRRLETCYFQLGNASATARPILEFRSEGKPSPASGGRGYDVALLSSEFADAIDVTRIDVNRVAIYCIANNSAALDIYLSLCWLLPRLEQPRLFSWSEISSIFGTGFRNPARSRAPFLRALQMALAVYPQARVIQRDIGIELHPDRPGKHLK
jgi:hypothetical protein